MTNKEILTSTDHRPWPILSSPWVYYQEWNRAIFLHWEVNLAKLRKWVPDELEIDLIDGKPWVSLVAFTMKNIRPKFLPSFSPISNFHEINIRTYVKANGKTGVYFLSIEGGKKLSCIIAKAMSELPYRFSKMTRAVSRFESMNSEFGDHFSTNFQLGEDQPVRSEFDKWLTERYALFQDGAAGINKFEIHHLEWPTKDITVQNLKYDYPRFNHLFSGAPDKIQYSTGVKVLAWDKEKLGTT
jgi:uncharacterized protein YqjF (DUF2071 family)